MTEADGMLLSNLRIKKDDLVDTDVMAYSAIAAGEDGDGDGAFSSGGAIMDALEESDPSLKTKPVVKKPAPKKPTVTAQALLQQKKKKEEEKIKALKAQKEAEIKRKKEEAEKKKKAEE